MRQGRAARRRTRSRPTSISPSRRRAIPRPRLVKKLEELGIGRPSTYAAIISVLQDREYVRLEKKRFVPEDRGRLVTAFLTSFFERYVEYDFTAELEDKLDEVSGGRDRLEGRAARLLGGVRRDAVAEIEELRVTEVLDALNDALGAAPLPRRAQTARDPRICPACGTGRLSLKLGSFGAFVGCSNYPECRFTRQLGASDAGGEAGRRTSDRVLGNDPATGEPVVAQERPLRPLCPARRRRGAPSAARLPPGLIGSETSTSRRRCSLLALPREVGRTPRPASRSWPASAATAPTSSTASTYVNLPADEDVLTIGLNRAVALLAEKRRKGGRRRKAAAPAGCCTALGPTPGRRAGHACAGRYGPYVKHGKVNASAAQGQATRRADAGRGGRAARRPRRERQGQAPPSARPAAKAAAKAPAQTEGRRPRPRQGEGDRPPRRPRRNRRRASAAAARRPSEPLDGPVRRPRSSPRPDPRGGPAASSRAPPAAMAPREIARGAGSRGRAQKTAVLRDILTRAAEEGDVVPPAGKSPPERAVLETCRRDGPRRGRRSTSNGDLIAWPAPDAARGSPPSCRPSGGRPAPGVGDRVLARLPGRRRPATRPRHQACCRAGPTTSLGVFRAARDGWPVEPADRRDKAEFIVAPDDARRRRATATRSGRARCRAGRSACRAQASSSVLGRPDDPARQPR